MEAQRLGRHFYRHKPADRVVLVTSDHAYQLPNVVLGASAPSTRTGDSQGPRAELSRAAAVTAMPEPGLGLVWCTLTVMLEEAPRLL